MNFLEIQFALGGTTKTLPADHGYALYSAVKQLLQKSETISEEQKDIPPDVRLCSVSGIPDKEGKIYEFGFGLPLLGC